METLPPGSEVPPPLPPPDPIQEEVDPIAAADAAVPVDMPIDPPVDEPVEDLPPPDNVPPEPGLRVFEEIDGLVAVEAEHYDSLDDQGTPRSWHLTDRDFTPDVGADPDESHADGASSGSYLEGLPDTRVTHDDPLQSGTNFFNRPGTGPILRYRVFFNTPGRYYGWARANTTGTEDNGLHLGLDGEWPNGGARMQWCGNRGNWAWSSAQRDSGGSSCGQQGTIVIDVPTAGEHTVEFSMREDGFEFDKWLLTTDPDFTPNNEGPAERLRE